MKSEEWKSYRTRFLVNAKQLNSTISFVDHLGRQHHGRKGDYLVESSDGVVSVAPRRIFEDIYVPMPKEVGSAEMASTDSQTNAILCVTSTPKINVRRFEPLSIENMTLRKSPVGEQRMNGTQILGHHPASQVQRKLPQPCRDRRSPSNGIGMM